MSGNHEIKCKKGLWLAVAAIILIAVLIILLLSRCSTEKDGVPTLTVETPGKISLSQTGELVLDVSISDLGQALYPAASMSISFDSSRLEFLGLQEGNVFVYDDANASVPTQKLPEWSCSVENSNAAGLINIMYLDMTGGKYAFSRELLAEEDNVVLRLHFRLRGSSRSGDVLELILEDAVFAASDETESLAMTRDTLKTRNGRLVIGE